MSRGLRFVQSLIVFSSLTAPVVALANADGAATAVFDGTSAINCELCHKGGAGTPTAAFVAPAGGLTMGTAAAFQLTITGGPAKNAGATIAATDATLTAVSPNLKLAGAKLVHDGGGTFPGATFTYEFMLTPTGPNPSLSAAVASCNADTVEGGDSAATTKLALTLGGGGGGGDGTGNGDGTGGGANAPDVVGYMNFGCNAVDAVPFPLGLGAFGLLRSTRRRRS